MILTMDKDTVVYKMVRGVRYGSKRIAKLVIPTGALVHVDLDRLCLKNYITNTNARARVKALGTSAFLKVYATGMKLRASEARVVSISDPHGRNYHKVAVSDHDETFVYRPKTTVHPRKAFATEKWAGECASGIHFFMTRLQAASY